MPEIGEVARIVHFIRKRLVGKTLVEVKAQHDENVFGKVGTSAAEFEKCLTGKKIESAGQQGKYFWLIMSSPPHPVCHFGMAGWFKIRDEDTAFHKSSKPGVPVWPPKHWKFTFETAEEPKCEAAFVDYRRFGRIRLVDCAGKDIRHVSPLKSNGPDPVLDRDVVTEAWLVEKLAKKKVPIKALLLNQAVISGIGNWVGDEILFNARIHPEQYSNTLSATQVSQLHKSLHYVISHAVDTLVDWESFPEFWLFKYRWDKGNKKKPSKLPNGAKIEFLTVGGRTSAVVPSVQKKTGPVAGDVNHESDEEEEGDQDVELSEADEEKTKPKTKKNKNPKSKDKNKKSADIKPNSNIETPEETIPSTSKKAPPSAPTKTSNPRTSAKNPPSTTTTKVNEPPTNTLPPKAPLPKTRKRALKPDPDSEPEPELQDEVEVTEEKPRSFKKSKVADADADVDADASLDLKPKRRSARISGAAKGT